MQSNEISLSKFLARYHNLKGKDLSKITHDEVKWVFPELKRTSFELVERRPELLQQGVVLLVNDGHKTIPYIVPQPTTAIEEKMEVNVERENVQERQIYNGRHDYTRMSIYELKCLLKDKFSSYNVKRRARLELKDRGVVLTRKYDRVAEKQKIEREKNEGY